MASANSSVPTFTIEYINSTSFNVTAHPAVPNTDTLQVNNGDKVAIYIVNNGLGPSTVVDGSISNMQRVSGGNPNKDPFVNLNPTFTATSGQCSIIGNIRNVMNQGSEFSFTINIGGVSLDPKMKVGVDPS